MRHGPGASDVRSWDTEWYVGIQQNVPRVGNRPHFLVSGNEEALYARDPTIEGSCLHHTQPRTKGSWGENPSWPDLYVPADPVYGDIPPCSEHLTACLFLVVHIHQTNGGYFAMRSTAPYSGVFESLTLHHHPPSVIAANFIEASRKRCD